MSRRRVVDRLVDRVAIRLAALRRLLRATVSPDRAVVVGATVGLDAALFAAVRYGPAYVHEVGAGTVVVGLFGAVVLGTAAVAAVVPRVTPRRIDAVAVAAAVAGVGLGGWVLVPDGGLPGPPWLPVVAGAALVAVWIARVPAGATGFPPAGLADVGADLPAHVGSRAVLTVGAVLAVVVFVTAADGTVPAVQFFAALTAALGVAVATVRVAVGTTEAGAGEEPRESEDRGTADPRSRSRRRPWRPAVRRTAARASERLGGLRRAVVGSRSRAASVLVADTLVGLSVSLASVFVVLTVTGVLELSTTLAGRRIGPAGTFGLLVCVEVIASAAAVSVGPRLAGVTSPLAVVVAGYLAAVAFPLLLVSVPPDVPVVAGLFACFGARFCGGDTRRGLVAGASRAVGVSPRVYRTARTGIAALGPLVGGLAFAVSPVLAFGAATAVGIVGVWELCRLLVRVRETSRGEGDP